MEGNGGPGGRKGPGRRLGGGTLRARLEVAEKATPTQPGPRSPQPQEATWGKCPHTAQPASRGTHPPAPRALPWRRRPGQSRVRSEGTAPSPRTTFSMSLSKEGQGRPLTADAPFRRPLTTERRHVPPEESAESQGFGWLPPLTSSRPSFASRP